MKTINGLMGLFLLGIGGLVAQNTAIFWQGFSQDWTYNHRINRMTDYVTQKDNAFLLCHAGASGTGADSGRFVQHYTTLETPEAQFYTGFIELKFEGKEGDAETQAKIEKITLPAALQGKKQYYVVLNGFDLLSIEKADKFIEFGYSVDPQPKITDGKTAALSFKADLKVDCRSPECEMFKHIYSYSLKLYYTLIAADDGFVATPGLIHSDIKWDKINEIGKKDRSWFLSGREGMGVGIPAIHSFSLKMDKEHWVQKWETSWRCDYYDVPKGEISGKSNLSFIEWTESRKDNPAFKKYSMLSLKDEGTASMEVGVSLLQFKTGNAEKGKRKGEFLWPGKNAPATDGSADCQQLK